MGILMVTILILFPQAFWTREYRNPLPNNDTIFNISEIIESAERHPINQGEFLIDTNIVYVPAVYDQFNTSVAFDGTNYLVVWQDYRNGSAYKIYGARVTPNGTVLDPAGIAISTANTGQWYPSVAFDGTNYLVVWQELRDGSRNIYGARVTPNGAVLDTAGIAISNTVNDSRTPSVAFDGTNYLVVWQELRIGSDWDIYGARVTPNGAVLDTAGIAISTKRYMEWLPSVAFDGTNYLVVWQANRGGLIPWDIYGARVTPNGAVLDTAGIAISTKSNVEETYPSVAFDGTNYLVVWRSGGVSGARVAPNGTVLDPAGFVISTDMVEPWTPSVAFDGTNYLVVWRSGYYDGVVSGARVTPNGAVLDTAGIAILTYDVAWFNVSVAFDGTNYLVVCGCDRMGTNPKDIYGARVAPNGTVLDTAGIAISTAGNDQWLPSVAFDGTNYLVVWQDSRNGSDYDIYGARVAPNGAVLDTAGIAISTAGNDQQVPSVAFDGTNYLVVWEDLRNGSDCDIYGARVNQNGAVLNPAGIAISTAGNDQQVPSVTFDGTNYLVVWQDLRNGSRDIYGALVRRGGSVIESFAISTESLNQMTPALTYGTRNQFLIVYVSFADFINNYAANTMRIWGNFYLCTGIEAGEFQPANNRLVFDIEPNPFRFQTKIKYGVAYYGTVSLKIYNVAGQWVRNIVNGKQNAGFYEINWNGEDDAGRKLAPGIYFFRLETEDHKAVKKVMLLY